MNLGIRRKGEVYGRVYLVREREGKGKEEEK